MFKKFQFPGLEIAEAMIDRETSGLDIVSVRNIQKTKRILIKSCMFKQQQQQQKEVVV